MPADLTNTIGTIIGILVAGLGAFLFAFWLAMGIWTFNDIRSRTRDWLAIGLACLLVLIFPVIGLVLYMMIRPKETLAEVYDRALEEEALLRELDDTLTCLQCATPVKEGWVFCPNCHEQLQANCPKCGSLTRQEWDICVFCGVPQGTLGQPPGQSRNNSRSSQYPGIDPQAAEENLGYSPMQMGDRR